MESEVIESKVSIDKFYLIISRTCDGCGNHVSLKLKDTLPLASEVLEIEEGLGGMFCIQTKIVELQLNTITEVQEV